MAKQTIPTENEFYIRMERLLAAKTSSDLRSQVTWFYRHVRHIPDGAGRGLINRLVKNTIENRRGASCGRQ